MASTTSEVSDTSCSQACIAKMNWYKEQLEIMTRKAEDLSYEKYELKKEMKPLKVKLEATTKDFKRIAEENSVNRGWLRLEKEENAKLTAELEALKAKYQDNEFSIRKFDASRTAVETLIDEQTRYRNQDKEKKGIGYNEVPPPWNDNYTSPLETKESEEPMQYGKPTAVVAPTAEKQEDCASTSKSKSDDLNDTNVSSSCAGEHLDEGHEQDNMSSKSNDSVPVSSSTCVVEPGSVAEPNASVKSGSKSADSKCVCSCSCGNSLKQNQPKTKSQNQPGTKSPYFGPGPNPNHPPLKRQTCFNCGIPGHIARNCPHRPYVPYYAQGWQNVPRGRSFKRNPSRSRSRDGNWNEAKAKRQKKKDKQAKTCVVQSPKSNLTKKPVQKSSNNFVSKSGIDGPIQVSSRILRPVYKWVP
ncbi:hypothetical protein E9993_22845, partial [Labilibacter sediminis]